MSRTATGTATGTGSRRFGWPVWAWGLWDWGSAAFNAVITTFVFSVYITSDSFGPEADTSLGWALAGAGVLVAVLAPVSGQRADRSGRPTRWLGLNTLVVVVLSAALFLVEPREDLLWLGLLLLAAGNVFFELASVNYNALLHRVATPATVGRVSGLGWGMGYLGGIVLLLVVYLGLISPEVGLFGVTDADGLDVRVTMLFCAGWTLLFSLPVLLTLRDAPQEAPGRAPRVGVLESYRRLFASVRDLWREDPRLVRFLGASAVFRDGLAGVFTFGGVLAAGTFGFSDGDVIVFGIAANVVAGISTIAAGWLDDRLGPKRVIVGSLVALVVSGTAVFVLHDGGRGVFWGFGLLLSAFVGPAQSASRTFLARIIPAGREGQVFGLYATTGRAVSFLAPAAFSVSILAGAALTDAARTDDAQYFGVLGVVAVLLLGLVLMLPVHAGPAAEERTSRTAG
ncbi:MFS transporter [Nocardioides sp. AX2bis]|uniref:MFS transporter n=1 Tax=Nocardioides sp. AX2bis TaxID=2653157 RepID=UPI0019154C2B|nr:MFS transporter [Nocardioides sp. AX2bis]